MTKQKKEPKYNNQIEDKMVMSVFYNISEDCDNNYILDFYDIEKRPDGIEDATVVGNKNK